MKDAEISNSIERCSLSYQIQNALVGQISSGQLKSGDRLIEIKIARDMQTSQAPVREAMRALEAFNLIEMKRNRGAMVRTIDPTEIRDIYAVQAELEGLAAETAARIAQNIATSLFERCRHMSRSLTQDNTDQFVQSNDLFHRTIVEASQNAVLIDI